MVDVVVVDDADDVRAMVALQLRLSRRFDVVGEGGSGVDAIALAARHRPALMLLDASMPDMDGLEALPPILRASPSTKVVMFSGFAGPVLETAARALGAAGFLEKAVPVGELPARLLGFLESPPAPPPPDMPTTPDAEVVMAEHLERFRTVFDQAAVGMATMTLTGTIVRANQALAQIARRREEDLVGQRLVDLAGPDTVAALETAVAEIGGNVTEVTEVEHSLGGPAAGAWVRTTVTAVRDSRARPLYLFVQTEDITSRRLALEELRASEERFRLLVEAVSEYAIFMLDETGRIKTWNTGAQRMKGYRADEIIGRHFEVFYPAEARDIGHPQRELEIAVREGRYEEEGWRIRKDGSQFWASVVITALFDHTGHLIGFGKVTRDVTDRRLAAEARERAADELREANRHLAAAREEIAEFLAVTAHELHSPITAMTGAADILMEHWDDLDATERSETLRNLIRSGSRLGRLLDDLLTTSRLEAGSIPFNLENVDVATVVAETVGAMVDISAAVEVAVPEHLAVRADPTRVVQILSNLLSNASKYGGRPITVRARENGGMVEIRVHDSGPGIAAELQPRLFEKFARGQGRRDRGTGLGLFIVRALARGQGGDAWYEGEAAGGPCFAFALPAA